MDTPQTDPGMVDGYGGRVWWTGVGQVLCDSFPDPKCVVVLTREPGVLFRDLSV